MSGRSGHTSIVYNDSLVFFGGLEEIAHEVNDV